MRTGICKNDVECFAKKNRGQRNIGDCTILKEAINDYPCPFAKEDKEITNGIHYPFNPIYAMLSGKRKEDEE